MKHVTIHHTSSFNHGCRDYATVEMDSHGANTGTVIDVQNCTSCWQVGHDSDHVFATVGERVQVHDVDRGETEKFSFVAAVPSLWEMREEGASPTEIP